MEAGVHQTKLPREMDIAKIVLYMEKNPKRARKKILLKGRWVLMCKKCSFDIGSGYRNDCSCLCSDLTYVDSLRKGDVYGCQNCGHLIDGFFEKEVGFS